MAGVRSWLSAHLRLTGCPSEAEPQKGKLMAFGIGRSQSRAELESFCLGPELERRGL
jgi:hypothetical protein